jgi:hypothetical protein
MVDMNFVLLEFFSLIAIIILIFSFSAISAEPLIIIMAIFILSILVFPYLQIVNVIEEFMFDSGFENEDLFHMIYPFTRIVILFVGIFLVVELFYVFLFN